jgi:transposase-like protein
LVKRNFTDLEKVQLVLASIPDDVVVTEFCEKHGIARSSFYAWRKALLANLSTSISSSKRQHRAG